MAVRHTDDHDTTDRDPDARPARLNDDGAPMSVMLAALLGAAVGGLQVGLAVVAARAVHRFPGSRPWRDRR